MVRVTSVWVIRLCLATVLGSAIALGCQLEDKDGSMASERSCGPTKCETGESCCEFQCVDTRADDQNCGGCGLSCGAGEACVDSACVCGTAEQSCGMGQACCPDVDSEGNAGNDASCRGVEDDSMNCGACGIECASGQACVGGMCTCQNGLQDCDGDRGTGCETRTLTDVNSCGVCGNACIDGQVCFNGTCASACGDSLSNCAGSCVNTSTDSQHCGACGNPCAPGEKCSGGSCQIDCQVGLSDCGGNCVNFQTDKFNCGGCGASCDSGLFCADGTCVVECPAGQVACGGSCISAATDQIHCGAAGQCDSTDSTSPDYQGASCGPGTVCSAGTCVSNCPTGQVSCAGGCVDLNTDRAHCGACGDPCGPGQVCSGGQCQVSCPAGQSYCSPNCVSTDTDRFHCGGCGTVCPAGQVCSSGVCATSCPADRVACEGNCVNPNTDLAFCGASLSGTCSSSVVGGADYKGVVCAQGEKCLAGTCELDCPAGTVNCGGSCRNPTTDRDHCGATLGGSCDSTDPASGNYQGQACAVGELCANGSCVASCPAGQVECLGACINIDNDDNHCGGCNVACGANQQCVNSVCVCRNNFADCNRQVSDGCESYTPADPNNCGADADCRWGDTCGAGEVCLNAVCDCAAGLVRCGGSCIDPDTNNSYCGASGSCNSDALDGEVCGGNQACVGGICSGGCPVGQSVCDGACVDIDFNPTHCGGCNSATGTNCNALPDVDSTYCSSGACVILSCVAGMSDCDSNPANGCETAGACSCDANGVAETGESCDGTDLRGLSCTEFGFTGGTLACSSCGFDTSGCTCGGDRCAPGAICSSGTCYCGQSECTASQGDSCTFSNSSCECAGGSKCGASQTCSSGVGCQ